MSEKIINTRIKNKHDTHVNFTANNPVLLDGEIIFVTGDNEEIQIKIGDGITPYIDLPFMKLKSLELTGIPTTPTPSLDQSDTQIANTEFVKNTLEPYASQEYVNNSIANQTTETWTFTLSDGSTVTKNVVIK